MKLQKSNGTYWLQADPRVTVKDKSSVNMLTRFSPVLMAPIQEGGAASSTDVAEQFPDPAKAGETTEEPVSIVEGTTASSSRAGSMSIESESEVNSGNAHTTAERYA